MTIDDYFASIERSLRQNIRVGQVEEPITCLASDNYNGLVRCRVYFWDGSSLDIYEVVSTELGYPVRVHYAYRYLRAGKCVFRYDNAPHHPEIATHPHHKHIGAADRLAPTDQPRLNQVLAEIEGWLGLGVPPAGSDNPARLGAGAWRRLGRDKGEKRFQGREAKPASRPAHFLEREAPEGFAVLGGTPFPPAAWQVGAGWVWLACGHSASVAFRDAAAPLRPIGQRRSPQGGAHWQPATAR